VSICIYSELLKYPFKPQRKWEWRKGTNKERAKVRRNKKDETHFGAKKKYNNNPTSFHASTLI
jgi:hypothetical protein